MPKRPANPPEKKPFDIDEAMTRLREAVRPFPRAAMFELADEGYDSVFELLVACIISIRKIETVTMQPSVCLARVRATV
jgi:endonuclease-3